MKSHTIHLSAITSTGTVDVPVIVPFSGVIRSVIMAGTYAWTPATVQTYSCVAELTKGSVNAHRGDLTATVDGPLIVILHKYLWNATANTSLFGEFNQFYGCLAFPVERQVPLNLRLIGAANMNTFTCECLVNFY